jgi:hypothetical protein
MASLTQHVTDKHELQLCCCCCCCCCCCSVKLQLKTSHQTHICSHATNHKQPTTAPHNKPTIRKGRLLDFEVWGWALQGNPRGEGVQTDLQGCAQESLFSLTPQEDALSCHSSAIRLKASNKNPTQETTQGQGPPHLLQSTPHRGATATANNNLKQHPNAKLQLKNTRHST